MENESLISALQTVISPVVLISGVGLLVLSMTNRFSHMTNRARLLAGERRNLSGAARERADVQIRILHERLRQLLLAIALALGCVLLAAILILTLFANYLFGTSFRGLIVALFSLSLLSLIVSLILFIRDMSAALSALQKDVNDFL